MNEAGPPKQPETDEPSLGREIVRAAAIGAQPVIDDVVGAVSGIVLVVVFVPLGLVALVVSAVLFVGVFAILGNPTGTFATVVSLAWWLATLAAVFVLFQRLYRRLARRIPMLSEPVAPARESAWTGASAAYLDDERSDDSARPEPTLAELDARLAPKAPARPSEPPGSHA